MASSVSLLIRGRQIRLAALLETREAIEPFCARLAATNRTDEDLDRPGGAPTAAIEDDGALAEFLQANVDWHVAVARASHNELLTGLHGRRCRGRSTPRPTDEKFVDAEVRRTTVHAHTRDHRGDPRRGTRTPRVRRMTRHVHSYAEAVAKVERRDRSICRSARIRYFGCAPSTSGADLARAPRGSRRRTGRPESGRAPPRAPRGA